MLKNNICNLRTCFLCRSCLTDWIPVIETHKKNIVLKRGQLLFQEGDPVTGIYFVYEGVLKVHKKWDKEKELVLRFAKGGDIVGHLGLGNLQTYPVSATATSEVTVCYIDMTFFESTLNVNHEFVIKLMRFFANELNESEKRMRNLAHMSVRARVAQALISLKNQFGLNKQGFVAIELTRQDLASFTGAVYESLFRTINELTDKKLINITGKNIAIADEARLLKIIEDDNL